LPLFNIILLRLFSGTVETSVVKIRVREIWRISYMDTDSDTQIFKPHTLRRIPDTGCKNRDPQRIPA